MSRSRKRANSDGNAEAVRVWGDVVRLGGTIVTELGLADSKDTLGRWMAHRLAELMDRAKSAKNEPERETAQKAASDLIIALWDHRAGWPRGWPPRATSALTIDRGPYMRREESTGSAWLDSLSELEQLHAREREVWVNLGLLDFDVESERRAAKELTGEDETEEREAIEHVIALWDSAKRSLCGPIGDEAGKPEARAHEGLTQLRGLDLERRIVRERILQELHRSEAPGRYRLKAE